MMDSFLSDHKVERVRSENVRLMTENSELRKMVALMQENLELRYALRDHGSQICTMSQKQPNAKEHQIQVEGGTPALATTRERGRSSPSRKECPPSASNTIGTRLVAKDLHHSPAAAAKDQHVMSSIELQRVQPHPLYVDLLQPDVTQVHSLQCYTCTAQTSNSNCKTVTNCTASDNSCMTTVQSVSVAGVYSAAVITKSCSLTCSPSSESASVVSNTVTCCSTDLCNVSGASSMKISYMVLATTVGFIGVLLRAGL